MRKLLLICAVAVALVSGIAIYAVIVLKDVQARDKELKGAFAERADALRALDAKHAFTPRKNLDPKRFPAWLSVRTEVAAAFKARIEERSKGPFHARETHNQILELMHAALDKQKMSLKEYQATSRRWQALLARPEFKELRATWAENVFNRMHPKPPAGQGLPLPDPASDAPSDEVGLIRKNEMTLADTLHADLLGPLLDSIEANTFLR